MDNTPSYQLQYATHTCFFFYNSLTKRQYRWQLQYIYNNILQCNLSLIDFKAITAQSYTLVLFSIRIQLGCLYDERDALCYFLDNSCLYF